MLKIRKSLEMRCQFRRFFLTVYIPILRHTLIVVHKDVEALKKHNDEFYPTVIFNLYSFPVFLSKSDYALIDKNPQVTVMKNIIEKIGYPKIFYDVDS
ncbi:MAG: hypothetical protein RXR43_15010 [Sulfolobus sp.]